jgi:hypothetical protein
VRRILPDDGYHDYAVALILNELVPATADHNDIALFFRETLSAAINDKSPWWTRLAPYGRQKMRDALTVNEEQCFLAAGLFAEPPTSDVLDWWDALAQRAQAIGNENRLRQGRVAEQLTIDYEIDRLARLGIDLSPRWIALDDNFAGYDIHSFDVGPIEPVARLIEVKSCDGLPLEIYLTRNEWETALERAQNYHFHVWKLPEKRLLQLTPADIAEHIPGDGTAGRWQVVKITLEIYQSR